MRIGQRSHCLISIFRRNVGFKTVFFISVGWDKFNYCSFDFSITHVLSRRGFSCTLGLMDKTLAAAVFHERPFPSFNHCLDVSLFSQRVSRSQELVHVVGNKLRDSCRPFPPMRWGPPAIATPLSCLFASEWPAAVYCEALLSDNLLCHGCLQRARRVRVEPATERSFPPKRMGAFASNKLAAAHTHTRSHTAHTSLTCPSRSPRSRLAIQTNWSSRTHACARTRSHNAGAYTISRCLSCRGCEQRISVERCYTLSDAVCRSLKQGSSGWFRP